MGRRIERVAALPFVKWAGGKRSIIEHLIARTPRDIKTYYEPFLGGGALFFALASRRRVRFERAYLSDMNVRLMRTYAAVTLDVEKLIAGLKVHESHHGRRYYLWVRARPVDKLLDRTVAASFIYLNKTCFNGLYRVNLAGDFNVPMGKYAKPVICDEKNLRRCSIALSKNVYTGVRSFEYVKQAKAGDFVYFDPPYYPISKSSDFTRYTSEGFNHAAHVRLRDLALALKDKGVRVLISNSNASEVREMYAKGFTVEEVLAPRSVNSKAGGRGKITDLLIT